MPLATAESSLDEKYAIMLRTNVRMRRRVERVSDRYGISLNAAMLILLDEALEARGVDPLTE